MAKSVTAHFRRKQQEILRKAKKRDMQLRRTAKTIWKSVSKFWQKVDKIVVFQVQAGLHAEKKQLMDKHLEFLIARTERMSKLLGDTMQSDTSRALPRLADRLPKEAANGATAVHGGLNSPQRVDDGRAPSDPVDGISSVATKEDLPEESADDGDFSADSESDDETTMAAEEAVSEPIDAAAEVAMLKAEQDIPIEKLRELYGAANATLSSQQSSERSERREQELDHERDGGEDESPNSPSSSDDSDFDGDSEPDDETTVAQEEAENPRADASAELAALKAEQEIPIEELRKMYSRDSANEREVDASGAHSGSSPSSSSSGDSSDDSFSASSEEDDETTLADADAHESNADHEAELAALKAEQSIPIEKLREMHSDTTNTVATDPGASLAASSASEESESSDGDFSESSESDDETTLADAEATDTGADHARELAALKAEQDIPIEQLREMLADKAQQVTGSNESSPTASGDNGRSNSDSDEDFSDSGESDDETTLAAEEKLSSGKSDSADEISALLREQTMPIEELKAMYAVSSTEEGTVAADDSDDASTGTEVDSDEDFSSASEPDDETTLAAEEEAGSEMDAATELAALKAEQDIPLEKLRAMHAVDAHDSGDSGDEDQHIESSSTPSPYLLSKTTVLRSYQLEGLDWLASMERRALNGILADEMGLGKTLQTISLLAHLAAEKCVWGPHLVVVPTSTLLNWEVELKKFCPSLKVLSYYGSIAERKKKREGWSKANAFHVCITSYQLVVQDASIFRRKRWYYLILDEAQNIKNFQSKRWQTLLHFNTKRRLLLTGTPLQNSLMELWSLMHFLMPSIFRSRGEFKYWFSNPLTAMVEGKSDVNRLLVSRLHGVIRPFILRRLKSEVAKQLPSKHEHVHYCGLSRRQRFLYEEFMSRSSTRATLSSGSVIGMMGVLMQLRKVRVSAVAVHLPMLR